jgi:flavin-binding protein dodecin
VKVTTSRPRLAVSCDGRGVVGHGGSRLLADLAEVTGLESGFVDALAALRQRASGHAPGRVAVDLAVMLADGGEAISDLAALRDQAELFGPVASAPTAWRVLKSLDAAAIARLRGARAAARELAWAQCAESRGALPQASAAGRGIPGLVLDIDATIVICHSEKQGATGTWKKSFGYHPLLCFLDNTGEALSGILRPGRAGSNTAADHIEVLDTALAQIPDAHRHGGPVLVRTDTAGCTHAFLAHIRSLRESGVEVRFSVGAPIDEPIRQAITALPAAAWYPAIEADGQVRDGAEAAEITGLLHGYGTNRRRARTRRAEEAALPAATRRSAHHQIGQAHTTAHRRALAPGETAGHSLRTPRPTAPTADLLSNHNDPAGHDPKEPERTRPPRRASGIPSHQTHQPATNQRTQTTKLLA